MLGILGSTAEMPLLPVTDPDSPMSANGRIEEVAEKMMSVEEFLGTIPGHR